ncbi:MAG: GNAT family N-acetyltransferase [Proteobacteria bacterium]|nr:GNAT family N-acetyltransferase [Pseudomonadota bacterium]
MDPVIEHATMERAEEVLALQKLAYQSEAAIYQDATIPPLRQTLEEIKADFQRQSFLVALVDGVVVGSVRASLKEGVCHIGRLIVHPEHQNRGLGAQLMQAVEAGFPDTDRFELFTGHKSEKNLHLYEALGYRIFRTEPVHDRLMMVFLEKHRTTMAL